MRQVGLVADVQALFGETSLSGLAQQTVSSQQAGSIVPANRIDPAATVITPDMLPLLSLSQAEIDRVVATVEGGVANVQDIYPLAPLQEGVLYHHLQASEGDPYLVWTTLTFDSRGLLMAFVAALQEVIDRHDSLRTGVVWEGLRAPVQVVWRRARLEVGQVHLAAEEGPAAQQLQRRFDPRHYRLSLQQAPLMQAWMAQDGQSDRWVLHWLLHHLVDDAASVRLLMQEMSWIMAGQRQRLLQPMPYRNYVAQTRQADSIEAHEAFFRGLLGDVDEPTLPYGLADVQGDGCQPDEARLLLSPGLSKLLRDRVRVLKASPAGLFHLAWGLVLGAVTGGRDVVFGTVLLGRMQSGADADRALGMYINTLPLRLALDDTGVTAALQRTQALLAELVKREQAPLVLAQRCSGVRAPLPLFGAILNYRHDAEPAATDEVDPLAGIEVQVDEGRTNYPLALGVDDLGEGFALMVQAASPIDAQRICGYLQHTLEGLVEALERTPQMPLNQFDRLPPDERKLLLEDWNQTRFEHPTQDCLQDAFEAQVLRTPDATALVFGEQQLSYAELNAQANRLARHLRGLGVQADTRVAVCVEPSLAMVVGLLAVLKAGGAYLPMDPSYPFERLAYLLGDCVPIAVLAHAATREILPVTSCPVVDLDVDAPHWCRLPDDNPRFAGLGPRHLAYLIYTSGSTGQPKGVMVEHRNVVNQSRCVARHYGLGQGDRVLQFVSFAFDVAVEDIFASLLCGAAVVLRHWPQTDVEAFFAGCAQQRITAVNLPAAFLQGLLRGGRWSSWPGLRRVTIGGEAVDASTLGQWFAQPQAPVLFNAYGPTETTVCATLQRLSTGDDNPLVIGRPIGNTHLYVLDTQGNPAPLGVTGELWIGGAGVARGYLNRESLSAERFVASPFMTSDRLYRTGDLVRYLPDGTLEYRGRGDFQVKIRGFRIELGEVETVLLEHAWIREAVALVCEPVPGDKRLVAYVVPAPDAPRSFVDNLRQYLQARLPAHMVPAALISLTALPLTSNGKLDRRALPAPDDSAHPQCDYQAPQGDTEMRLARIWQEVLQVPRLGRHDDFFEAGGHSLLMIQVAGRAVSEGLELSINDLFTHPNVASLAAWLDDPCRARGSEVIAVRKDGTLPPLFLIHEVSGLDAYYSRLARNIEAQVPVWGLLAVPEGEPQLTRIEVMARRLVGNIRAIQAEGPYRIAGYSFGGVLAYEVAQQLSATGQGIAFLGLIDTVAPGTPERLAPQTSLSDGQYLVSLCLMELERDSGTLNGLDLDACEQIRQRMGQLMVEGAEWPFNEVLDALRAMPVHWQLLADNAAKPLQRIVGRVRVHVEAIPEYIAGPAPAAVTLFVARDAGHGDPWLGWGAAWRDQQHRRIEVAGDHYSIMNEHCTALGQVISQALRNAAE
ncbi:non-ribosomal peptide synthetase [Pseudomonas sp. dw_612]|uniref:non-ribosomal peptide synthetase n=1 Tax=Pseudomonas sp. dw_612 TaxID=2720080 RepID=UPI001BD595DC|nr:non-ribosomal peptide synthetase [Pseudomonas sp. dw_612]